MCWYWIRDMDRRYPGLREVLEDPYGDLYLDGRYEAALQFLGDQVERRDGGLEINTLYDPEDLEGAYILAALERLLLDCDVRSFDRFMEDLSITAFERDMEGAEGWDKNYLNEAMLELLRIDCQATARRIDTDPVYRWRVQNKKFSSWLRESTSAMAYTAVLYASMLAASNVPGKGVEDTVDEETKEVTEREEGSGTGYGSRIKVSEQKMYQQGQHYNKHGRDMGFGGKKEYEAGARDFIEKSKSTAEIFEGKWNSSRGSQGGETQIIIRSEGKQAIINKETGQIIDFYEGTSLDGFIDLRKVQ